MKFVLTPIGSAGDVQPITWVARLLADRGQDVVVIAPAAVAHMPERAGLRTIRTGDEVAQQAILHHPDFLDPRRAFKLFARHMPEYVREALPAFRQEIIPGQTVLIAGTLTFAARIAAEAWNVPMLSLPLQPTTMLGIDDNAGIFAGGKWLPGSPRWFHRAAVAFANWSIDRELRQRFTPLRRELGIPDPMPASVMRNWWHGTDGVICLFPDWYAPQAADWPAPTHLTRFPLYDEAEVLEPDPELERFLAGGTPPIIITPGSGNAQAARFLHEAAAAAQALGRRAILATRFLEQVPAKLPDTIRAFRYIPFSRVFPRAAAVVHQGGIGTIAQCLAAAVPQLIMPVINDQPDNANRIKRFGTGDFLYPKEFVAPQITRKLQALLTSEQVKSACAAYQRKMSQRLSPQAVTDLIESLSRKALLAHAAASGPPPPSASPRPLATA